MACHGLNFSFSISGTPGMLTLMAAAVFGLRDIGGGNAVVGS